MSATFALIASLATGAAVGAVLRSRLATTHYRLPDELDRPQPASWWVVPVTAAVTALAWWAIAPGRPIVVPIVYVLAVWTMVVLAFVDLDVQRLPDAIQLPAYPVLAVLLAVCSNAIGDWSPFARALLAGVALFVLFLVLAILPGGGMGFGDVKLAGLLGMLLGWLSWTQVMWATLATFLIGGVVAVAIVLVSRKGRRHEFAYGPSMLLGAVGALVAPAVLRLLLT
ncbi:A24 family peptidase [Janibacter sp. DB-40]|uniref:prepilin peptidase n=1 Tax=Janibacter sp. DB-40 TaxID=3028808 RepID=UPI00240696D8|nr:A24 family peptidase [Janibacter sp. DB-40]